jgi:hypothetical protein
MNFLARIFGAVLGALVVVWLASSAQLLFLVVSIAVLLALHLCMTRSLRRLFYCYWPMMLFAGSVYALRLFSQQNGTLLALRILFVFACVRWIGQILWLGCVPIPTSRPIFRLYLFTCFIRHFMRILGEECRRMLTARRTAAPHLWRRQGFASIVHAMTAIFLRSLTRAERFYAAQQLKGLGA